MGRRSIDITNKIFGRLKALGRCGKSHSGDILWKCVCECGNTTSPTCSSLVSGNTKSCGCLHREFVSELGRKGKLSLLNKRFGRLLVVNGTKEKTKCGHYKWLCKCDCGVELLVIGSSLVGGATKSCGCYNRERLLGGGKTHIGWKGGVISKNIALYDTYASRLNKYNVIRKGLNGEIETKCAYCGKWCNPTRFAVKNRLKALNSNDMSENRLYCSNYCKNSCSIFNRKAWPKGFKSTTSREVQPELRQLVLERDNYTCQYGDCGLTVDDAEIHCHHIEGINQNPIESADMDICISLCKEHHKYVHSQEGCRYFELKCKGEGK